MEATYTRVQRVRFLANEELVKCVLLAGHARVAVASGAERKMLSIQLKKRLGSIALLMDFFALAV